MSSLKSLAQKAKYRLRAISNENNEDKTYEEACLSARVQYAIISSQKKVEDDPLYNKVKKILAKDMDTICPLSSLIEPGALDGLDQNKVDKYMFNLSKRYARIKEHCLENDNPIEAV